MENRVIEDYIILTYRSSLELRNDVLEKITEGYIPQAVLVQLMALVTLVTLNMVRQ